MAIGAEHAPPRLDDRPGEDRPGGDRPGEDRPGEPCDDRWAACSLDELGDAIRRLDAAEAAARAEKLAALAELARRHGHHLDGCATPVDWLMAATTCTRASARDQVDVAAALQGLPALAAGFAAGLLSFDQLVALVRFVTPDTDAHWAVDAVGRSAHELAALARSLHPPTPRDVATARRRRHLRLVDHDHETLVRGRLPAADGALLRAWLEPLAAAAPADTVADTVDHWGARLIDALCARAAQTPPDTVTARRAVVVVHATPTQLTGQADTPAVAGDALTPLAHQLLCGLLCDCQLEVSVDDPHTGHVLGIGRAGRNIPAWLARRIIHRDHTCRVPGCDRPAVHLHHLVFWEAGGPTTDHNLAGLCWHHHQRIHADGFTLTGNANHTLDWKDPNGRLIGTTRPAASPGGGRTAGG
ncbi:MAG: DUF222 domain-containing protein [Acidimicrobiales bacterium]|nr:DUF222 domain-containing protein [Acidimicrobiales bacterium]